MPERFSRIAALILVVLLIIALPLLISLFGALNGSAPAHTPTAQVAAAASPTRVPPTLAPPTPVPPTRTPVTPSVTPIATIVPSPMPSATAACPIPATPEPLWVNPVISPTNLLTQKISVTLGRGRSITITSEGGTVTQRGQFSTTTPVDIEIALVPNAQNNVSVSGTVEYAPGCFYTLETRTDRVGNPLIIVQSSAQNIPTPAISPTPPTSGTVYLVSFSQVFALNQDTPSQTDSLWLYEGDAVTVFEIVTQEGAFTRLNSQDGKLNFWTLNDNLTLAPPPLPVYDTTVAGKAVQFVGDQIFACEAQAPNGLGLCTELAGVSDGQAVQRTHIGSSELYEVSVNGKMYWVSSNVLKAEPS